jgi:hypothetical protein
MSSAEVEAVLKNPASSTQERIQAAKTWVTELTSLTPYDGLNEIERADYLRWQNLSLSYSIPDDLASRVGFNDASVTVSGSNLLLWTKYGGVDPLAAGEANQGEGDLQDNFGGAMDTYGTPQLRTYSVSLQFGF